MKKYIVVFTALLFAVACSVKKSTPKVELSKKEENVTKQPTNLTDEEITQINDGRNLYNQKCGTCHDLYSPSSKTKEQWSRIVPDMAKRSQESNNKINYKEEQYILKFLQQSNTK